jgi:hypothetical protein
MEHLQRGNAKVSGLAADLLTLAWTEEPKEKSRAIA